MNFEKMVLDSIHSSVWGESKHKNKENKTFSDFEDAMKEHFECYSGEEYRELYWNDWKNKIENCYNNGATIQRVMFLEDIKSMDISLLDDQAPWTLLNLFESDLLDYLKENAEELEKSSVNDKIFVLKTVCPKENVCLNSVPIPHEHLEMEVNVINNLKLPLVEIYEKENNDFKKIGTLDFHSKKVNLIKKSPKIKFKR